MAHEEPLDSGTPTCDTKPKPTTLPTQGYLITTWTSKIAQWTVTKDGTAACFDVEAYNSHVAAELFTVGIWSTWDVWLRQGRKYSQCHAVAGAPVGQVGAGRP